MDNIEIQILDSVNNIIGTLTVADDDKFPLSLSKGLANIKNINERSGSYSTSFKIASTKENDILLEHLYYASEKNYKDWDADKRARIIVNGIDIDTGRLKVDRVSAKGNARDYNFTFFGDNMDWVLLLQDKYFNDLPYLDQSISYDATTVEASWSNTYGNNTPVFSLINRGYRIENDTIRTDDVYPDYFTYDVIKDAFNSVGYKVNSSFLEQAHFKKLLTPFFGNNFRITDEDLEAEAAFVKFDNSITNFDSSFTSTVANYFSYPFFLDNTYSSLPASLPWFNGTNSIGFVETAPYYDNGSNWDATSGYLSNTTYTYTAPSNGYYRIVLDTSVTQFCSSNAVPSSLSYGVYKRIGTGTPSSLGAMSVLTSTSSSYVVGSDNYKNTNGVYESVSHYLNQGERMIVSGLGGYTVSSVGTTNIGIRHHDNSTIKVTKDPNLVSGNPFNWQEVSDNQYSLLKYITDIGKIFNLYFRTNTATRTVYIETRDDFYKALTTAVNWTDKIDDNKQHELYYNSKYYTQIQNFRYVEDSDDKFVDWYNDKYNEDYQELKHEYPEKFKTGTTTLSTEIIAPTISVRDNYSIDTNVSPIVSFMWEDAPDADNRNPQKRTNWKPRLLYYNYGTQLNEDGTNREWNWNAESTNRTNIPYCLSFSKVVGDKTLAEVAGNLDFKDLISYSYDSGILDTSVSENGLFSNYYRKTAREIQEGRRLSINLFIDLVDYKNLDLRQPIYFDNRYADIEGYWRIEKINNFKVSGNNSTRFELIQAKNFLPLPYNNKNSNTFGGLVDEGFDTFRTGNFVNNTRSRTNGNEQILGYNNLVEPKSVVVGNNLTSSATNTTRLGSYNLDVSSDTFQLGAGTPQEPFSLIRVDEDGNIYFNGDLIKGADFDSTKIVTKTLDFVADRLTNTYLIDTSSNDVQISLRGTYKIGDTWNFKKISASNLIDFTLAGGYQIDYSSTSPQIIDIYDNYRIKYIGAKKFIII